MRFLADGLNRPRALLGLMAAACVAALSFGIFYLQNVVGLHPCPMCIVQRYALIGVALLCAAGALWPAGTATRVLALLAALMAGLGAFVAARQSWLQWYPPEVATCGRDFYGMIEAFPLGRVIPMVFAGSGDCAKVDWRLLGGTLANWSFVWFVGCGLVALVLALRGVRRRG